MCVGKYGVGTDSFSALRVSVDQQYKDRDMADCVSCGGIAGGAYVVNRDTVAAIAPRRIRPSER